MRVMVLTHPSCAALSFHPRACVHVVTAVVSDSVTPWTVPPGSSVHGILQASILTWVAMLSSRIFLTQGLSLHLLCLLHQQAFLYH